MGSGVHLTIMTMHTTTLGVADGLLVMHKGKVVYEYLVEGIPAWRPHSLNSASKVFTGCVAAILADQGKLTWDRPLHEYAPQLKGTGDAAISWTHMIFHASGLTSPHKKQSRRACMMS